MSKIATPEQKNHVTPQTSKDKFIEWNKHMEDAAAKLDTYGGKRLLGRTAKGNDVWVKYSIDKETLTMKMDITHDLDNITTLAPRRTTVGANRAYRGNPMRPKTKGDHGEITESSLRYLKLLKDIVDSTIIGKVNGKCSTQLFMLVSNFVYEGGTTVEEPRWRDVMATWDLPSGSYLTVYG